MHRFRSHQNTPGMFRGHLHFGVPVNPVCWLLGHRAKVTVVEPKFSDPYRVIRCTVCDRRHNDPAIEQMAIADYMEQGMSRRDAAKKVAAGQVETARRDPRMVGRGIDPRSPGWQGRESESVNLEAVWYPTYYAKTWRWGRVIDNLGFRIHTGGRGSETPIDLSVHAGVGSVYLSTSMFGRATEFLGRGHKREFSLLTHGGTLWWQVWYDDDGGNDSYHDCDRWRTPRLWPWSAGRRKHRSWMCLRSGSIDLNPVSALWGRPTYHRTPTAASPVVAAVPVGQFSGDTYLVELTLERTELRRDHGPRWARRGLRTGYNVDWDTRGHCNGIPVRNDSWKGDEVLASGVSLPDDVDPAGDLWAAYAVDQIVAHIKNDRIHYGYTPPKDAVR